MVELREEGASLEFLGYLFRWDRDRLAREWGYWNRSRSAKSVGRERERLREMTSVSQSHVPLPQLIERLNRQMRGWANYFSKGYPRGAYWELDWYLRWRFMRHLRRRGQRRFRPPKDEPWYYFFQRQGLLELNRSH